MTLNITALKDWDDFNKYHVSVQHEPDSTVEFVYDSDGITLRRIYKDGTIKEEHFYKVWKMEFKED